jgi:hypothetical protein
VPIGRRSTGVDLSPAEAGETQEMIKAGKDGELRIHGQHIVQDRVILGATSVCDQLINCTVERCDVMFVNPRAAIITGTKFVECTIQSKKGVHGFWGDDVAWDGCSFRGQYLSTHFGLPEAKPVGSETRWGEVVVRGCDFSQAVLHGCAFKRTDVASTRFPAWPCFTVLQPQRNRMSWKAVPAPVPAADLFNRFDYRDERDFSDAEVFHWPSFVKSYKESYQKYRLEAIRVVAESDPEEVRRILASLDFVRL